MNPPTAIEIVRAHIEAMREIRSHGGERVTTALASVLRDAERFRALEAAADPHHEGMAIFVRVYDDDTHNWKAVSGKPGTLAELADKLRCENENDND
jgi:hypothetical protein